MKPAYWIGVMALVGAVLTYLLFKESGIGAAVGALVGTIIYERLREKQG